MCKKLIISFFLVLLLSLFFTPIVKAQSQVQTDNSWRHWFDSMVNQTQRWYLRTFPGKKSAQAVLHQAALATNDWQSAQLNLNFNLNLINSTLATNNHTLTANFDLKKTDESLYFKLNQLSILPVFDFNAPANEYWFNYELPVQSLSPNATATKSSPMPVLSKFNNFSKLLATAQLQAAYKEKKAGVEFFVVKMVLTDETLMTAINLLENTAAKQQLTQLLAVTDELVLTLWIRTDNFYLTHLELPVNIDVESIDSTANLKQFNGLLVDANSDNQQQSLTNFNLNIAVDLTAINEKTNLNLPEKAINLSDLNISQWNIFTKTQVPATASAVLGVETQISNETSNVNNNEEIFTTVPELPYLTEEQKRLIKQYENSL